MEHFEDGSSGDQSQKIASVKNAVSLLSYLRKMQLIFDALEFNKMTCFGSERVQSLFKLFQDLKVQSDSFELKQVGESLALVKKGLDGLSVDQVELFNQAVTAVELVKFFEEEKDFETRIGLVQGQLQGQEFSINMLADLQIAHNSLTIFLKKGATFEEVLKHVKESPTGKKLEAIASSLNNLTEIKIRFAQFREGLKGIVPRILSFMKTGRLIYFSSSDFRGLLE